MVPPDLAIFAGFHFASNICPFACSRFNLSTRQMGVRHPANGTTKVSSLRWARTVQRQARPVARGVAGDAICVVPESNPKHFRTSFFRTAARLGIGQIALLLRWIYSFAC